MNIRMYHKVLVGMTIFVLLDVVILSQFMSVVGGVRRCGCSFMRAKSSSTELSRNMLYWSMADRKSVML